MKLGVVTVNPGIAWNCETSQSRTVRLPALRVYRLKPARVWTSANQRFPSTESTSAWIDVLNSGDLRALVCPERLGARVLAQTGA